MGASGYEPFWGAHHDGSGIHYSITIRRWHQNWRKHKDEILQSYGDRWYRLWEVQEVSRAVNQRLREMSRERKPWEGDLELTYERI